MFINTKNTHLIQTNPAIYSSQDVLTPTSMYQDVTLRLILVRHAESTFNVIRPRIVQGQSDPSLTTLGQKQACFLAHRLAKLKPNYIYSSDLERAMETAKVIAAYHKKPVLKDQRLREQCMGNLTSKLWRDVKKSLSKSDQTLDHYLASNQDCESVSDLKLRLVQFYVDLVEKHILQPFKLRYPDLTDKRLNVLISNTGPLTPTTPSSKPLNTCIVVVTHGGPILQLLKHFIKDLNFQVPDHILHPFAFPKSTSIYEIQLQRRYSNQTEEFDWKGRIHLINCVSHLAGLSNFTMKVLDSKSVETKQSQSQGPFPYEIKRKPKEKKKESKLNLPMFFQNLEEINFERRIKSLGW